MLQSSRPEPLRPDRPQGAEAPAPGSGVPVTRVVLLGSTGSIGRQALDVIDTLETVFDVVGLAAGRNVALLAEQARRFRPSVVVARDDVAADALAPLVEPSPAGPAIDRDPDALVRLVTRDDVDLVVVATGGVVSLSAVIAALAAGKVVATANKETLVTGGHLVMPLARRAAARVHERDPRDPLAHALAWLRPIDSEHSAIWQCLVGEEDAAIERLWITSSGGPFRRLPAEQLAGVTPARALEHPTWTMGAKITIDSATLMNKGLEVVEALRLYDVPLDRISVVVHPQSIVHGAVEFSDGSIKAQLGQPDMRIPIQYALTYPERRTSTARRLRFDELVSLDFEPPDDVRFPAVSIAREAARCGPRASTALIASDEVAVDRFLAGTLDFPGITRLVAAAIAQFGEATDCGEWVHRDPAPDDLATALAGLSDLIALDAEVRAWSAAWRAR
jgi:1-deoxy-D-xylulose-5-phosphate reductoisomerase